MYNPSETSECYMVLANPQRQIWFIPQRHLLAHALLDSDELFLSIDRQNGQGRLGRTNGNHANQCLEKTRGL